MLHSKNGNVLVMGHLPACFRILLVSLCKLHIAHKVDLSEKWLSSYHLSIQARCVEEH